MSGIERLLIIGCGNMGGAMLAGWLASGLDPARFAILDPALKDAPDGVAHYHDTAAAGNASKQDAVLLGFKPQQLGELKSEFQALIGKDVTVHSLLAGLTLAQLGEAFPQARALVRVMPNLAARIGKSPIILLENGLDSTARGAVQAFYDQLGMATWLGDEAQFDLVTALAGSGPGFVYRFIDALAQAASELGLAREQADQLALTMVEGASALAAKSHATPGALADRVASTGGMTREGLDVLDADQALVRLLKNTLAATRDRGAQMSRGNT